MNLCLLDKIAHPPDDRVEAIRQHLREMLNTTVGGTACAPDFGTLDHTHPCHDWDHTVKDLKRSIMRAIESHEHRLSHVRVTKMPVEDSPRALCFRIRARLEDGSNVEFRLQNDPRLAGRVDYWMI